MSGIFLGDILLANDGEYVYLDDDQTQRLINDGGVLKLQKYESDAWVDYQTWGE